MFKTIISFLVFLAAVESYASVKMRWLSVASILIEDEKTRILFDPAFTRPEWKHWFNLTDFKSDEELVREVLKNQNLMKVDAVFASHSHFDHVIDAPSVAKITGAKFYVDKNSKRIADAYRNSAIKTKLIQSSKAIHIGDFVIYPIHRKHTKLWQTFDLLPGEVPADFGFGFYEYKTGETWLYVILHPKGNILIDQGPDPSISKVQKVTQKIDVLIQGLASRKDDEQIQNGYLTVFRPKIFIPNHFDNFFLKFDPKEKTLLPGIQLENFFKFIKTKNPELIIVEPEYGDEIKLLE